MDKIIDLSKTALIVFGAQRAFHDPEFSNLDFESDFMPNSLTSNTMVSIADCVADFRNAGSDVFWIERQMSTRSDINNNHFGGWGVARPISQDTVIAAENAQATTGTNLIPLLSKFRRQHIICAGVNLNGEIILTLDSVANTMVASTVDILGDYTANGDHPDYKESNAWNTNLPKRVGVLERKQIFG